MDPGIRLTHRRRLPRLLSVLSVLLIVACVGAALAWFAWPRREANRPQPVTAKPQPVTILGGGKIISGSLSPGEAQVVDGRTISVRGQLYRLVGFDAPETGLAARCPRERELASRAAARMRQLVSQSGLRLQRVPCACPPGTEGTPNCDNAGWCAVLTVGGHDVGPILITEGLARPYVCGRTSCPPRQGWC
jgi:endonuclease YncB( thermonuclease family)